MFCPGFLYLTVPEPDGESYPDMKDPVVQEEGVRKLLKAVTHRRLPDSIPARHYENIPIQIYWKFYHQKKNSDKNLWSLSHFCSKYRL